MDLLTPTVNVPAERAKLLALRNEIAADVEHRKAIERKYTARGFVRLDYVPDLHPLDAKKVQRQGHQEDGANGVRPVCVGSTVGIPTAFANLRQAQAGCCGCGGCANRVEREGVSL